MIVVLCLCASSKHIGMNTITFCFDKICSYLGLIGNTFRTFHNQYLYIAKSLMR